MRILVINPGTTSTKIAAFRDDAAECEANIKHSDVALEEFRHEPIHAQMPLRIRVIDEWLNANGLFNAPWDAIAARGGLLPPMKSGVYEINAAMLEDLRAARRGDHASNLGAPIAAELARRAACKALIVDPVSIDELDAVARPSGFAGLDRTCLSHALNTKAVAKRFASALGQSYDSMNLIVAHLGSGISVSAHHAGRMVDVNNSREEGPFSADRCGGLPALALVELAIREQWTLEDAQRLLFREGGIYSYLGGRDVEEVMERVRGGDAKARLVIDAMVYQVCKEIGAMAAVLSGKVDAILLTGGMTHATEIVAAITERVKWFAPVTVFEGEDEMRALAEGAERALSGREPLNPYYSRTTSSADLHPTLLPR